MFFKTFIWTFVVINELCIFFQCRNPAPSSNNIFDEIHVQIQMICQNQRGQDICKPSTKFHKRGIYSITYIYYLICQKYKHNMHIFDLV